MALRDGVSGPGKDGKMGGSQESKFEMMMEKWSLIL